MGQDKALLAWPGPGGGETTLYERAAAMLALVSERVEVAVGTDGRLGSASWPTFPDSETGGPDGETGAGPLAGLLTALERAQGLGANAVLVLACDMPLVGLRELQPLVAALKDGPDGEPGADVALWVVEGRDQPLCAAYRTTCAIAARKAFDGGERRVVRVFDGTTLDGRRLRVKRLIAEGNSARRLVNVNTKSDYDRALQEASEPARAPESTMGGSTERPNPHDR